MLNKNRLGKLVSPVKWNAYFHLSTLQSFARRHFFDVNEVSFVFSYATDIKKGESIWTDLITKALRRSLGSDDLINFKCFRVILFYSKLKQNFFFIKVKLVEYIFSAVKVCSNPCVALFEELICIFCYYQYDQNNSHQAQKS